VYLNSVPIVAWQTIHRAGLTYQLITSPWYPQSNGQAEQTVHTVKRLLTKSTDCYWAIAQLPYPGATSAQLSFWWGDESGQLFLYLMSIWSPSGPTCKSSGNRMMSTKESRSNSLTSVIVWMSFPCYQTTRMSGLVPKANRFREELCHQLTPRDHMLLIPPPDNCVGTVTIWLHYQVPLQ